MDLNQLVTGIKTFFNIKKLNKKTKSTPNKVAKTGAASDDTANGEELKQNTDDRSVHRFRAIAFLIATIIIIALGGLSAPIGALIIGALGLATAYQTKNVVDLSIKIHKIKKALKEAEQEETKTRAKEIAAKDRQLSEQDKKIKTQEATIARLQAENKKMKLQLGIPITPEPPRVRVRRPATSAPATPAQPVATPPAPVAPIQPVAATPTPSPSNPYARYVGGYPVAPDPVQEPSTEDFVYEEPPVDPTFAPPGTRNSTQAGSQEGPGRSR